MKEADLRFWFCLTGMCKAFSLCIIALYIHFMIAEIGHSLFFSVIDVPATHNFTDWCQVEAAAVI